MEEVVKRGEIKVRYMPSKPNRVGGCAGSIESQFVAETVIAKPPSSPPTHSAPSAVVVEDYSHLRKEVGCAITYTRTRVLSATV